MRNLAFLIALVLIGEPIVAASEAKLAEGLELPRLESHTLSGDAVTLPQDARGQAVVLVVGFSKAAAKVMRPWMDACRAAAGPEQKQPSVYCYDVRMLEDVPRPFRGMVERSMRKGYPPELSPRTLLIYTANDAWRERLGATDNKTAYVVGCDAEGRVRRVASGNFVDTELAAILAAIAPKKQE